jgi:hypothetical protein
MKGGDDLDLCFKTYWWELPSIQRGLELINKHSDVTLLGGSINAKNVGQKPPLD